MSATGAGVVPLPAMPPRPARPLPTWKLLRTLAANSLAACDEELFDALVVERRYVWGRLLVVSDPDGICRVLQDNADNYRRVSPVRRAFEFSARAGMVCLEGEDWRRHRRIVNPALDRRALAPDLPAMAELAQLMGERLAVLPRGEAVEVGRTLGHLLVRMNGRVFAGDEPAVDAMLERMGRYPETYALADLLPLPRPIARRRRSRSGVETYYPLLDRLVAERRRPDYAGGRDLLWRLANTPDRSSGVRLTPGEVRDEVLTLAATAMTTLRPLTWLWYLMALNPSAEARLHAELDAVLGGRPPAAADMPKLAFLRQALSETMRLYPPLPLILRSAAGADVVGGRRVPRGAIVAIIPWVVHRHRRLWADPDHFDADRFAAERAAAPRFAYIPFGVGPHVCPGAGLAQTELGIAAAALAQRFRFRLAPGQAVTPAAWTTLRPHGGIRMTIEQR